MVKFIIKQIFTQIVSELGLIFFQRWSSYNWLEKFVSKQFN